MALARAGEAYIAFAQTFPALFRLLFASELVDPSRFADVQAAGSRCYATITAIVAGIAPVDQVADATINAWCLVHGYATLCLEAGLEEPGARAARADKFAEMVYASVHAPVARR